MIDLDTYTFMCDNESMSTLTEGKGMTKDYGRGAMLTDVIAEGIKRAAELGLTKPMDVATCVKVELEAAGLRIVRKPKGE